MGLHGESYEPAPAMQSWGLNSKVKPVPSVLTIFQHRYKVKVMPRACPPHESMLRIAEAHHRAECILRNEENVKRLRKLVRKLYERKQAQMYGQYGVAV